jgi:hypothetical protein
MKDKIRIASGQGFWGDLILYPELGSGSERFDKIFNLIERC